MESDHDLHIHPWWVRKSRFLAGLAGFVCAASVVVSVVLIAQFQFGHEAWANATDAQQSHLVYDEASPADPSVSAYFDAQFDTQFDAQFDTQPGAQDLFQELGEPEPGDWLDSFDEPGQSVDEYFASGPNAVTSNRYVIYLQPLGNFDEPAPDLGILAEYIELYFGLPTRILPVVDPQGRVTTRPAWGEGHLQWRTTDLLWLIHRALPADGYAVLGVTMTDLYPADDWAFVFGQARSGHRVAVHSFARYRPSSESDLPADERERRVLRRVLKVSTHELGHVFGIRHCTHYRCNMNGANSLDEGDASPLHVCPIELEKLQIAVGFRPAQRYRRLAEFYRAHGLVDDARWARRRLAHAER